MRPSSRYSSFDSQFSDPSSSSSFKQRFTNNENKISHHPSHALIKTKSNTKTNTNHDQNLASMVKKLMKPKSNKTNPGLFIPADIIAEDMKKTGVSNKVSSFSRKLFHKGGKDKSEVKALSEVKSNTRTLAMVLRSERELLNQNKEYENEIGEFKFILEEKNREVEKLKDLCLKQREEIKALKSAILFPDVMNSQLQGLLQKQGSELEQAKQVIPTLQRQVTSLTGQLQCLADDLAEVKADKVVGRPYFDDQVSCPEATISSEFSLGDPTGPESPDDMFLKDFNPCLTPYSTKTRSKEFDEIRGYNSPDEAGLFGSSSNVWSTNYSQVGKTSKSSEYCQMAIKGSTTARTFRWSNENAHKDGKPPQDLQSA